MGGDIVNIFFYITDKKFDYHHVASSFFQKSHSMPASDVASSGDFHPPSSSKSLYLSTENINQVFEECSKKYKKELIANAEKELKQLKTYVRKFSSREEMVIFFFFIIFN